MYIIGIYILQDKNAIRMMSGDSGLGVADTPGADFQGQFKTTFFFASYFFSIKYRVPLYS